MAPSKRSPRLTPKYMEEMSWREFEVFCQKMYDKLGYGDYVELTPAKKDGGRDLIIHQGRDKIYAECRHQPYINQGTPDIRDLYGSMVAEGAKSGIFVTTGGFSKDAIELAMELVPHIKLVARKDLIGIAEEAGYKLIFDDEGRGDTIYLYPEPPHDISRELKKLLEQELRKKGSDETILEGQISHDYGAFFRVEIEEVEDPFITKQGTKPKPKSYILIDAREPEEGVSDNPQASVYSDKSKDNAIGIPIKDLEVWDVEKARVFNRTYQDFRLTFEEAHIIASRYATGMAKKKNLPERYVTVRHVLRVMLPVYALTVKTYRQNREIEAAYINGLMTIRQRRWEDR